MTLGELGAKPLRAGESIRAKGAKDAKVEGMKDDAIAGESGGLPCMRNWMIKREISDRLSNPWRARRPWREPISGRGIDSRQGR